jgi:hypothetical protein
MKTGNVLGSIGIIALLVFVVIGAVAPKTQRSVVEGCVTGTTTAYRRAADAAPAHELTQVTLAVSHAQRVAGIACQCVAAKIMRDEGRIRMVLMDYGVLGSRDIASFDEQAFRSTLNLCSQDAEDRLVSGLRGQ